MPNPSYPKLWPHSGTAVSARLVQYAESGNADAAITAWSLLYDRGGVVLPDSGHGPIRQACGVVTGRPREAAARRFLDFLGGAEGRRVLAARGFGVPER